LQRNSHLPNALFGGPIRASLQLLEEIDYEPARDH
jgi:hypothetical protein